MTPLPQHPLGARLSLVAGLVLVGLVGGCAEDEAEVYEWDLPEGVPAPPVPEDNPMSEAKVELGRHLFYDARLSGNGSQSCASCHFQELAFADGQPVSAGSTGEHTARNSMGLANAAYVSHYTWANPTLATLEQQILIPMFGEFPVELGLTGNEEEVLGRLRDEPVYQDLFAAAFPERDDPFDFDAIRDALASFVRSMTSFDSPYDRFVRGDEDALSESARRGLELFESEVAECHHCHGQLFFSVATQTENSEFTQVSFVNNGLYNLDGEGAYPPGNEGLYQFTGDPRDMGKFRPPSLRNIALTAPYMHDGSVATLEEVIDIYAAGGRVIEDGPFAGDGRANPNKSGFIPGFDITPEQKADLLAFLESLTDETFTSDPRYSDPWD